MLTGSLRVWKPWKQDGPYFIPSIYAGRSLDAPSFLTKDGPLRVADTLFQARRLWLARITKLKMVFNLCISIPPIEDAVATVALHGIMISPKVLPEVDL
jgi:hypothetical protein